MKDKVFMSYKGKRIWYNFSEDNNVYYMVAKGDGTDEYFTDHRLAMDFIDKMQKEKFLQKIK